MSNYGEYHTKKLKKFDFLLFEQYSYGVLVEVTKKVKSL